MYCPHVLLYVYEVNINLPNDLAVLLFGISPKEMKTGLRKKHYS